jgi:hypothetical protein
MKICHTDVPAFVAACAVAFATIVYIGVVDIFSIQSAAYQYPYNIRERTLSIYEQAELATGAPAAIMKGFAYAESSEGRNMNHPNKDDVGMFGLNETPKNHAYRVALFGEYDPNYPHDAAYITGCLFMKSLNETKSEAVAICSHHQDRKALGAMDSTRVISIWLSGEWNDCVNNIYARRNKMPVRRYCFF